MSEKVVVQGGIRPWMFFVGLIVVSLVILHSTGALQKMRPLSMSEEAELRYAEASAAANDSSLAWAGASKSEYDRWSAEAQRIRDREPRR